jgi:hypothetical protein
MTVSRSAGKLSFPSLEEHGLLGGSQDGGRPPGVQGPAAWWCRCRSDGDVSCREGVVQRWPVV